MGVKIIDKDLGYEKIIENIKKLGGTILKVGLFGEGDDAQQNMAYLGAIHEFGCSKKNIPSRSFMRSTYDEKKSDWIRLSSKLLNKVIENKIDSKTYIEDMGLIIQEGIRKMIDSNMPPPLKQATINAKLRKGSIGGDHTLIDSGKMRDSLEYKIEKK